METIIHATDISHLDAVTEAIHDSEFELSEVKFDKASGVLDLRFEKAESDEARHVEGRLLKSYEEPIYSYRLKISSVTNVNIEDSARVEVYTLESLYFEESNSTLFLETDILSDFMLTIDKIDILVVRESPEPVGKREFRSIF